MRTVNTEGLPEPVAAAIAEMVDTLRRQFVDPRELRQPVELPRWPGNVFGDLTREEIYEDVR